MNKKKSIGHFAKLNHYASKTFGWNPNSSELQNSSKYKTFSPSIAVSSVFSGLLTGCSSAQDLEKHLEFINFSQGRSASPCRATIGSLLNEERTLHFLNNFLLYTFSVALRLRMLKLKEFDNHIIAFVDGIDLGEISHANGKCDLCLERKHKNGEIRHFHKLVVVSVMSKYGPLPIYYRFVQQSELCVKQEDVSEEKFKQECELSCTRKILIELAGIFGGRLPFDIIGGDALFANAPLMALVESLGSLGIFVFKQENRVLYKQAKADFCGHTLGFNVRHEEWSNTKLERNYKSSWNTYIDRNRKTEDKNVRIFETTRTQKNGETFTGMAITSDNEAITPQLVELVRFNKWHDLENGVFNELTNNWGTLKHVFYHKTKAMMSMIALQFICFIISQFYRYANLTRGGRRFVGTLKDFLNHMLFTFRSLKRPEMIELHSTSPP